MRGMTENGAGSVVAVVEAMAGREKRSEGVGQAEGRPQLLLREVGQGWGQAQVARASGLEWEIGQVPTGVQQGTRSLPGRARGAEEALAVVEPEIMVGVKVKGLQEQIGVVAVVAGAKVE